MHLGGHPADLDALTALCGRRGLALVEDCSHAQGATWRGRPVATWGDAGTFSFPASKAMTAGEGGAVVRTRGDVLGGARRFSDRRRRPGDWCSGHALGTSARMTGWQGAVLMGSPDDALGVAVALAKVQRHVVELER